MGSAQGMRVLGMHGLTSPSSPFVHLPDPSWHCKLGTEVTRILCRFTCPQPLLTWHRSRHGSDELSWERTSSLILAAAKATLGALLHVVACWDSRFKCSPNPYGLWACAQACPACSHTDTPPSPKLLSSTQGKHPWETSHWTGWRHKNIPGGETSLYKPRHP